MSDDKLYVNYELMQELSQAFRESSDQLQDLVKQLQNIAAMMEGGALVGQGGEAFSTALRDSLCRSVTRLHEKFEEISVDIQGAMTDIRDEDIEAGDRFTN